METCLYVLVASLPYVGIVTMNDRSGMPLMIFGGLVYGTGAVFFVSCFEYDILIFSPHSVQKMDGRIPFAHAIWHCFVVMGASIHTYAVYTFLLGPDRQNPFPELTSRD